MKKRIIGLILSFVLCISILPISAFAETIPVYVYTGENTTIQLDVDVADSVENIKDLIQDKTGIHRDKIKLYFGEQLMNDGRNMSDYNVKSGNTLWIDVAKNYLALGDSITSGHALSNPATEAFPVLVADSLGAGYSFTDLSESGETIDTLIAKLATADYRNAIKKADVITLTIGGNDLMNLLYSYLAENIPTDPKMTATEVAAALKSGNMDALNLAAGVINTGGFEFTRENSETVARGLQNIISGIRGLNNKATFIITTQYNPYKKLADTVTGVQRLLPPAYADAAAAVIQLSQEIETVLSAFNDIIITGFGGYGLDVANVYKAFKNSSSDLCNAGFSMAPSVAINLDNHPNAAGHKVIADTVKPFIPAATAMETPHTHDGGVVFAKKWTATAGEIPSGTYYLTDDVTLTGDITIPEGADVKLCLNGHLINQGSYRISKNGAFTTEDCKASVNTTTVKVGGVELADGEYTKDGKSKVPGEPTGEGYAYYKDYVLTLNNFSYEDTSNHGYIIDIKNDITVNVIGESNLVGNMMSGSAFMIDNSTVVIDGTGTLDISTKNSTYGIYLFATETDLTIKNIKLNIESNNYSIWSSSTSVLNIESAKLDLKAGNYSNISADKLSIINSDIKCESTGNYYNIRATKSLYVENSNIVANGGLHLDYSATFTMKSGHIILENDKKVISESNPTLNLPTEYWWRSDADGEFIKDGYTYSTDHTYLEISSTKPLAKGTITNIVMDDVVYGDPVPAPIFDASSTGLRTVEYKPDSVDDSAYTTTVPKNAGKYTVRIRVAADENYTEAVVTFGFTIKPAPLTVRVNDNTINYGDKPAAKGVDYSGFKYDDDKSVVKGDIEYIFDYVQYDDVGRYTIKIKENLTADNYNIYQYEPGTLAVLTHLTELEWSVPSANDLVYDGADKVLTVKLKSVVNNDDVTFTVEPVGDTKNVTAAGFKYKITEVHGDKAGNYRYGNNPESPVYYITKADPAVTWPTDLTGKTGKKLSSITLTAGFSWKNEDDKILKGDNSYTMVYTPADTDNYNVLEEDVVVTGKTSEDKKPDVHTHHWDLTRRYDNTHCWYECFDCGAKDEYEKHTYSSDTDTGCNRCRYVRKIAEPTPKPTATPRPSAEPTATPEPTPTATPQPSPTDDSNTSEVNTEGGGVSFGFVLIPILLIIAIVIYLLAKKSRDEEE